jgi:hypothetical protein
MYHERLSIENTVVLAKNVSHSGLTEDWLNFQKTEQHIVPYFRITDLGPTAAPSYRRRFVL